MDRSKVSYVFAAALIAAAAVHAPLGAAEPPAKAGTMQRVLDDSKPSDWRELDPENTLYVELANGRVIIELAPAFAPAHVANIRELARGKYWDGLAILRSHDNYVVQWGDPDGGTPKAKPLGKARKHLPAEFTRDANGASMLALSDHDGWALETGFVQGFAVARDPKEGKAWLTHCYGSVGAGRDNAADSSNGTELYVVIGQSPRHLDRNITLVGRVISGMEVLSAIPRGTGALGFFEKPEQRVAIKSIRLLADVPASERTALEVLRTDTTTWNALVESRRNRRDDWYLRPAGHINVCNVPLPTRTPPATTQSTDTSFESAHRYTWSELETLAQPPPPQCLRSDGKVALPAPRDRTLPQPSICKVPRYPVESIRKRQSGNVLVAVDVDAQGAVVGARVLHSSGFNLLDDSAVSAVQRWRFHPALQNGEPVVSRAAVPLTFSLTPEL